MKCNPKKMKYQSFTLITIIVAIVLFNISIIAASESSDSKSISSDYSYEISFISNNPQIREFNELYPSIINNKEFKSQMIVIDGNITNVIKMPSNITAIKLPDKRIAFKYPDKNISILPYGSFVSYYENQPIVNIVNESTAFQVSDIVVFNIENLTRNASIEQSIDKLDSYKVNIALNELNNEVLNDNIIDYTINWGDGSSESFDITTKAVTHTYTKSGEYSLKVEVNDDFGITHQLQQSISVEYEGHLIHTYFLIEENKEPIAITTSSSISVITIGLIAFTETGKYKFLALLSILIPLYSRIQKEDVLDQFVRGQIFGFIKTNPGVHYNQIRRKMGIKNGTLSYHLSVLEKTELIKSRREGLKYRAFYPSGMKFPKNERFRLTELQIKILDVIKDRNGLNQKEIAKKIGKKPQTINYNIKVLKQADLIDVVKKGRKTYCYLKEGHEYPSTPAQ